MSDRIKAAREAACGKRGERKGHLLAKCPPMGTDAAVFWQAAMMEVNPHKVGICHVMFLSLEQREFFSQCGAYVKGLHSQERKSLDLDRAKLTAMGAW